MLAANGCTNDVLYREAQAMALDGARGITLVRESARARLLQTISSYTYGLPAFDIRSTARERVHVLLYVY